MGDMGSGYSETGQFQVIDTKKSGVYYLHYIKLLNGVLRVNQTITLSVDSTCRRQTAANHSATHLLHAALKKILGNHVIQKGSHVTASDLRFDFSHPRAVTSEELEKIEHAINEQIRQNTQVSTEIMSFDDAVKQGALALFDEKYDDTVRVLTMGTANYSIELCGGTHVTATGDIGLFCIQSESSVASGIRRIEAKTGYAALQTVQSHRQLMIELAKLLKSPTHRILDHFKRLLDSHKSLTQNHIALQKQVTQLTGKTLLSEVTHSKKISMLITTLNTYPEDSLRALIDYLKSQLSNTVIFLARPSQDKIQFVVGLTKDLTQKVHAGKLLNHIITPIGGKGGGRSDFAQGAASASQKKQLRQILDSVKSWLEANC